MEEHVNSIQPIDKATVHNICSGQVILNLAAAVKELVENSLDAGATSIEINVKEYGSESIEVIDNGHGVEERNFKGLTLKHYTSKLSEFGDLASVETFGFRGEALSSLCALSEMTIVSCHKDASVGTRLEYNHDGVLIKQSPAARQIGTTVILKNLFCTLPVRHKEFHSNLQKEFNKMLQVVTSYCLICTNTRFCCTNHTRKGKSTSLSTAGGSTMKENIACIFGSKQLSSLVEFHKKPLSSKVIEEYSLPSSLSQKAETFRMEGYISSCEHGQGRSSPDRQYFYINNRPFDTAKISRLVNEVYHTYNRHQYPFIFLNITTEKSNVDVNVTPDKRQIFMQNEKLLLAIIKCSLEELFEPQLSAVQCKKLEGFQTKDAISGHFVKKEVSDCNSVNSVIGKIKRSLESLPHGESSARKYRLLSYECENDENKSDSTSSSKILPSSGSSCQQVQCISTGLDTSSHEERTGDNEIVNTSTSNIFNKIEENKGTDKMLHVNEKRNKTFFQDCFSYRNKMGKKVLENSKSPLLNALDMFSRKQRNHMNSRNAESVQNMRVIEINATCSEKLAEDTRKEQEQIEVENDSINVSQNTQSSVDTDTDIIEIADEASTRNRKIVVIEFSMDKLKASMKSKVPTMRKQEVFRKFKTKITPAESKNAEEELKKEIRKDMFSRMQIIGQFNKGFIVTKLDTDLFIIDQHATDEKYNYEIMKENTIMETQKLLCPLDLNLTAVNKCVLLDNLEIFKKNGFDFIGVDNKDSDAKIHLISVPVSQKWNFGKEDVEEMIFMLTDCPGKMCRPSRMYQMFASRACRMSVMIGTVLSCNDMRKLVNHMGDIEQPWNCPHGRPTMRHLFNLALLNGS